MNLQKIIDLRQLITFDSFFINVCKEMGPRIAHFWNFCGNALIRVRLWSHGFAAPQYGLTLLDLSFWSKIPCWQDGKWRNSEEKKKDRWHVVLEFCFKRLKDNVNMHKPPKDPKLRKKWFNFVAKTQENVSKLNTVYIRVLWSFYRGWLHH